MGVIRKQEKEIVVSVVLIIVRGGEVTAGPQCVPGGTVVLASTSVVHRKKTGNDGHCESRNGGCELLFGDGAVEHPLNGGPCVSDSNWWVVSISQQIVNEFPGMWTRSASCLKDERDPRLMCGYLLNLFFSALLAISPGFVLAADTRDGLQEKGATMETSKKIRD